MEGERGVKGSKIKIIRPEKTIYLSVGLELLLFSLVLSFTPFVIFKAGTTRLVTRGLQRISAVVFCRTEFGRHRRQADE